MADNGTPSKFSSVINSTVAVAIARIALPGLIAIVGAFGTYVLHTVESSQDRVEEAVKGLYTRMLTIDGAIAQTSGDVKVLSSDITHSDQILTDHETRLRVLEHMPPPLPH